MPTDATGTPTDLGIPTFNVDVDAPSGLGFNAAMAVIDGLLQDRVTVAGTRVIANKLVSSDTQPAWRVFGDGKMEWGAGGSSATDTTLIRAASNRLATLGIFDAQSGQSGQVTIGSSSSTPIILFGNAGDTQLARAGSNQLQVGSVAPVSNAMLSVIKGQSNQIEWGHENTGGYRSTIGADAGDGHPFIAFLAEAGTNNNTFRTRGFNGTVLLAQSNTLDFLSLSNANADNQAIPSDPTLRVENPFASGSTGDTGLYALVVGVGTRRITTGAADSGGSGFRMLRVAN